MRVGAVDADPDQGSRLARVGAEMEDQEASAGLLQMCLPSLLPASKFTGHPLTPQMHPLDKSHSF